MSWFNGLLWWNVTIKLYGPRLNCNIKSIERYARAMCTRKNAIRTAGIGCPSLIRYRAINRSRSSLNLSLAQWNFNSSRDKSQMISFSPYGNPFIEIIIEIDAEKIVRRRIRVSLFLLWIVECQSVPLLLLFNFRFVVSLARSTFDPSNYELISIVIEHHALLLRIFSLLICHSGGESKRN